LIGALPNEAAMRIEFTYLPQDIRELQWLVLRLPFASKSKSVGWALFIICVWVLFWIASPKNRNAPIAQIVEQPPDILRNAVLPLIPWLLIFAAIGFFIYRRFSSFGKGQFRTRREFQLAQVVELTPEGVSVQTEISKTQWKWAAFSSVLESVNVIALQLSKVSYLVIPKRALSAEQSIELKAMIQQYLQPTPTNQLRIVNTSL
jgi:hypothetical protein